MDNRLKLSFIECSLTRAPRDGHIAPQSRPSKVGEGHKNFSATNPTGSGQGWASFNLFTAFVRAGATVGVFFDA